MHAGAFWLKISNNSSEVQNHNRHSTLARPEHAVESGFTVARRGKVTKAQAAPAAKHEVCGKGSAQLGLCLAITIFVSTVPCAVAIAVQTSADHSGAPDAGKSIKVRYADTF